MSAPSRQIALAYAGLAVAVVSWGFSPVFIRFLSAPYDPFTQAFLRYGSATAALLILSAWLYPRDFARAWRHAGPLLVLAVVLVAYQYTWTAGCSGANPTVAQLISKISLVLVILFSFAIFRDERSVIRSKEYLFGTLLCLVGVAFVLVRDPGRILPTLDVYTLLVWISALCWAVYAVWARHVSLNIHPVPMFTVLAVFSTIGLGALAVILGEPSSLFEAGAYNTGIAVLSGLFPIAAAHPAFHYAQRNLGSAYCNSLELLNPLITYVVAVLVWPEERLLVAQWFGGALLLAGAFMVLQARRHARPVPE